jgi:hypothetical protein
VSSFPFSGVPNGAQVALSVSGTAVLLTVPAGSKFAAISVETQSVRFRDDGSAPTASDGVLLTTTGEQPWIYAGEDGLSQLQFIATTGTAVLNISFYK